MYNYKITVQYDGARYKGWQRLGTDGNTIQNKLENLLSVQFGYPVEVIGSSRTDAGVHAIAQTANFRLKEPIGAAQAMKMFSQYLPEDIAVLDVKPVNERFHARYNAKGKQYLYQIWNQEYPNPFLRKYASHVKEPLDIFKMRQASEYFIGKHDFTAFSTASSKKKSMEREIYAIQIEEKEGLVEISVHGKSFLYNMVRRMVGTLIEVGLGKTEPEAIQILLDAKERSLSGSIAEAKGLFLEKVEY